MTTTNTTHFLNSRLLGFNAVFLIAAAWQIHALLNDLSNQAFISKFSLCFLLFFLLIDQLGKSAPLNIVISVLFCLIGDVLLQPLDMDYTDLADARQFHFILGVLSFCIAYGSLARYLMSLNPSWRAAIKAQPATLILNSVASLAVLVWIALNNQAAPYLLLVLLIYSPIVVGLATIAFYVRGRITSPPYIALLIGCNSIVFSDTLIGLTAFAKLTFPLAPNPVWILSTYIVGIFLVFNAVIFIEKQSRNVK